CLNEFGERTAEAVAQGDLDQVADLRAQVARLTRRIRRLAAEAALVSSVVDKLEAYDVVLDRGRTATLLHRASEERRAAAVVLRDRIREILAAEPMRPRTLAEQFDCDPSQVSRALRQLQDDGIVVPVRAPDGTSDARAHWFGLVGAAYQSRLAARERAA